LQAPDLTPARQVGPLKSDAAPSRGWIKIAASAYNAGQGGAARGVAQGNCDKFTTGNNDGAND
jgi:hypothetical protein